MSKKDNSYNASSITILEGLEAVRKRPAMYIGDSDVTGLHHIVYEIVDNSIDEALGGYADKIEISLNKDGSISVSDNGRGIPVDIHPIKKVSALEIAATTLHAGGKFDESSYKVSSGLHGVGLSVVNAVSTNMKAEVFKDGKHYMQEYKIGKPLKDVAVLGKSDETGTKITFTPDDTIFTSTQFSIKKLHTRFRQQAYLTAGVRIVVRDDREEEDRGGETNIPRHYAFYFQNGMKSYIKQINSSYKPVNKNIFYVHKTEEDVDVEVAVQYTTDLQERVLAFANNVHNPEGGTHLSGFRIALTKSLNDYFSTIATDKEKDLKLSGDDTREGLTAIVSVKIHDPQFEGQTKIKLNNPEVTQAVRKVVEESLKTYLGENPQDAKNIISRAVLSNKARKAAKAARDAVIRKGALDGGSLPGKLADCSSKDPTISELFIVEGDSAGGSAKQARDRNTQAIFPLRGKPLNTEKYRLDKIMNNKEIKDLVIALGTGISDTMNIEKLRYHKIVLMNDADVDGEHITTLVLTLFYRHLKPILEKGYLYVAQPPLYKVEINKDENYWVANDSKLEELTAQLKAAKKSPKSIQRFKGLGEMNPEQLWQTTMNPESRTLKQIKIEDGEESDKIFDILMGAEVAPRKKFIQTHSKEATVDI
ncbi:MAG TPA: DNA topoisomerase subunit B [Candidatus Dojkabacteria bacterium]|nr:DNA topoisomerase subunit B [Candidatus Dojkabacteria bacterium]HRO64814.1 DNA topoisomerase subunit B [Candidatus Dojkabacteria bacterium]HRP51599.1 DNA topoisomerase subunit B [Candidatus Dojkabacteria bacterium]